MTFLLTPFILHRGKVKKETANIIADAKSADRQVQECEDEIAKYTTAAQNALKAGNEDDARTLIAKKQQYESNLVSYKKTQKTYSCQC